MFYSFFFFFSWNHFLIVHLLFNVMVSDQCLYPCLSNGIQTGEKTNHWDRNTSLIKKRIPTEKNYTQRTCLVLVFWVLSTIVPSRANKGREWCIWEIKHWNINICDKMVTFRKYSEHVKLHKQCITSSSTDSFVLKVTGQYPTFLFQSLVYLCTTNQDQVLHRAVILTVWTSLYS